MQFVYIITIINFVSLLSIFFITFISLHAIESIKKIINDQRNIIESKDLKIDPFIEGIMHYAFNKGIKPTIMPGHENKNTLFDIDQTGTYEICEIFTTSHKEGTKGFIELYKQLCDKIDHYVENKDLIIKTIKEKNEVKA